MNRCGRNCWGSYHSCNERKNNMNSNKNNSKECYCCCCCKHEEKYDNQNDKCSCQEKMPKYGYGLECSNQEYDCYNNNFGCNNYYGEY